MPLGRRYRSAITRGVIQQVDGLQQMIINFWVIFLDGGEKSTTGRAVRAATTAREAWRQSEPAAAAPGHQLPQRQRLSDAAIFSATTLQRENSSRRTGGKDMISRR
jgi:hypothetical protein